MSKAGIILSLMFRLHATLVIHLTIQDDLTDEMVLLARQLKQSSLMMSQSVQNADKFR